MSVTAVESKKNKKKTKLSDPNTAYSFLLTTTMQIAVVVFLALVGSHMLYICKSTDTKIFPMYIHLCPYTDYTEKTCNTEMFNLIDIGNTKMTEEDEIKDQMEDCFNYDNPSQRVELKCNGDESPDETKDITDDGTPKPVKVPKFIVTPINKFEIQKKELDSENEGLAGKYSSFLLFDANCNIKNYLQKNFSFKIENNYIGDYFTHLFQNVAVVNYSMLFYFFSYLNKYSESIVVFLGPVLFLFAVCIMLPLSGLHMLFRIFRESPRLIWKYIENKVQPEINQENIIFRYGEIFVKWFLYILLLIVLFWGSLIGGIVLVGFNTLFFLYNTFNCGNLESKLIHVKNGELCQTPFTVKQLFLKVLKHKLHVIMYILTLCIIRSSGYYYGSTIQIMTCVLCLLSFFFSAPFYRQSIPGLDELINIQLQNNNTEKKATDIFTKMDKTTNTSNTTNATLKDKYKTAFYKEEEGVGAAAAGAEAEVAAGEEGDSDDDN